jgi:hypothetical protein
LNFSEFQKKSNEAGEAPLQFGDLVYRSPSNLAEPSGGHNRNIHSSYSPSKKKRSGKQALLTCIEIANKAMVQAFSRALVS